MRFDFEKVVRSASLSSESESEGSASDSDKDCKEGSGSISARVASISSVGLILDLEADLARARDWAFVARSLRFFFRLGFC